MDPVYLYREVQNKYVSTVNIDQKIIFLKTLILLYKQYYYLMDKNTFIEFCLKEFSKYEGYLKSLLRNGKIEFEFSANSFTSQMSQSVQSLNTSIISGGCSKKHNCHFMRINRVILKFPIKNQSFSFCCICARYPNENNFIDIESKKKNYLV